MRFRYLSATALCDPGEPSGGGIVPPAVPPVAPDDPVEIEGGKVRDLTKYERSLRGRVSAAEAAAAASRQDAEARVAAALAERDTAIAAAHAKAEARLIRAELKAAAVKAGMVDPADLANADVSALKLSEAGDVTGADEFIAALKVAKPHYFADAAAGTRTGTTSQTQAPPKPAAPAGKHVSEMTPAEIATARAALIRRLR